MWCFVHVNLESTPGWRRHALTPSPTATHSLAHTHWGGAEGRRTKQGCFCSEDTSGWRLVGCVRQHGHTPATPGSGVGLWPEREKQSVLDCVGVGLQASTPKCCVRSLGLVWLCLCMWVSKAIGRFLLAKLSKNNNLFPGPRSQW